jgi:hypothetical protein
MFSFSFKDIKYFGISICTKSVLYDKKQAKMSENSKQEKIIVI